MGSLREGKSVRALWWHVNKKCKNTWTNATYVLLRMTLELLAMTFMVFRTNCHKEDLWFVEYRSLHYSLVNPTSTWNHNHLTSQLLPVFHTQGALYCESSEGPVLGFSDDSHGCCYHHTYSIHCTVVFHNLIHYIFLSYHTDCLSK